ncbi:MAG: class I SAM-dependent methyltransferase [Cyanobacteria bacterium P01_A01_bin.135]
MNSLKGYLARQLRHPSGWGGKLILRFLNRENATMNTLALRNLNVQVGQHVLEIGFGGGDLIERLLKAGQSQVTAIDMSHTAVATAQSRFKQAIAANRLMTHQASAEAMPFVDSMFDAIVTVNTLYFWPDVSAVLSECQRCLKPGGNLVITYNSKDFLEAQQATQFGFQAYEVSEVETFIKAAGFEKIETSSGESPSNGTFFCTRGSTAISSAPTAG